MLLATAAVAASLDGLALRWYAIAGGGGRSSSAGYVVHGSAGQPAVGALSSASYRLGVGFWYGAESILPGETPTPTPTGPAPTPTETATPTPTRVGPTPAHRLHLPVIKRERASVAQRRHGPG